MASAPLTTTDKETLIFLPNSEVYVMFNWRRVPKAQVYRLVVANNPEFKDFIFSETTKNSTFLLQQKLPPGKLYWRLRAEDGDLTSDWTEPRTILVKYQ